MSITPRVFDLHKKSLGYSVDDLARVLCIDPAEMIAMYGAEHATSDRPKPKLTLLV
jgi:hypothetical protein